MFSSVQSLASLAIPSTLLRYSEYLDLIRLEFELVAHEESVKTEETEDDLAGGKHERR